MNQFCYKIYDFVAYTKIVFYIAVFLCILSFIIIINRGFNWGLDFTGGLFVEIISEQKLDLIKIKDAFIQSGFKNSIIQYSGTSENIIIRVPLIQNNNDFDRKIKTKILTILYTNINHKFTIQQINWIGPSSSKDLIKTGIIALLVALLCILIYITLRFEFKLAIGTIISLIYDIIIILGILSACYIEINSTIIAALISAIGYCLNDNIVIFDRIRENFKHIPKLGSEKIFNISLSQVLNRTIITSITTVMVLLILLIFGGTMLYEFSIVLLIGVIIGTISSIYIASLLAFHFKTDRKYFIK